MNIYSLLSLIAGLVCLFFASLVFLKGKKNNQNRSFSLATMLTGVWTLFPFLTSLPKDQYVALIIGRSLYIFAAFVPTSWFYFMINLLGERKEKPKLVVFYIISLFFAVVSFSPLLVKDIVRFAPWFSPQAGRGYFLFIAFFVTVFGNVLYRLLMEIRNIRGYRRSQLIYVTWAYTIGAISGLIHFVAAYTYREPLPHDIFIILYPCVLTYAILKHRLMDIKVAITRTGIFVAVYTLVLGLPFILTTFGKSWLISFLGPNWWIGPLILMVILATGGPFLYIYLQKRAEAILLRDQKRYQETLKEAARELARIHNLKKLLNLIVHIVNKTVNIEHSSIYLYDDKTGEFNLRASRNYKKTPITSLYKKNPLTLWLEKQKEPLLYEEINRKIQDGPSPIFKELEEQMRNLDATLIVPGFVKDNLLGFLVLGDKRSGGFYTSQDLNTFSVLANQTALAVENALLYENMEEQIKQRTEKLVEIQKQLIQAEKLASVGTLAGGVAHEINNPLTAILTNVQMLLTSNDGKFDRESLELIEEATKRCRTIVQKLMAYAKKPLETSAVSEVDLAKVIKNVVSFIGYQLEQENINLILDAKEDAYLVMGNHNELEQVVTNIILNARDAIKQIKKSGEIHISLVQKGNKINIIIKDEGVGIPKELLPKIFDPFFTTKEVGKGTGLGLSICQAIVEKHKGSITVQSESGKGSSFTVQLPKVEVASKVKHA